MPLTTDSLVYTKVLPSQMRPHLVARRRLMAKLEREAGRKLTLISAPAGFGKTTLLVEWLRERADGEGSAAWLSLDEGDNDPVRFLSYLVAALERTVGEGFGEGGLAALRSPEPPRMEAVLGTLINELAALPEEVTLILDDYHLIDSEPVHGLVSFLLEHLPSNAHLLISSRIDPPLPLVRLRARNHMVELDATELSFTKEEAATFLNTVMGLDLSAEEVGALEKRTEGWIVGLQLAALSMRDRKDVSGFIKAFSGSHRDVLDYLAEEVLRRQPERVQEFLLETSILDHLTGSLCEALSGGSHGQQMLERLERDNLFVVPLDDERRWYRYHHLFANFLRARLHREHPERIKELHRRAGDWYERNGLISEAVGHALAAEDHERAADLVEQVIGEMWSRGEVLTLLGWLESLPEEAKRHRSWLLLEHATALMVVGRLNEVEPLLREAEHAAGGRTDSVGNQVDTGEAHRRYVLGYVATIRAWRTVRLGDPQGAIELARQALALLPEDDSRSRNIAAFSLAGAYQNAGDLPAASAVFAEIGERGLAAGHNYMALGAMGHQAELHMAQGRLREAEVILRRALQLAAERGGASLHATGEVHVAMGQLSYEWNDLDAAAHRLKEGMEQARRINRFDILVDAYIALSRAQRARGEMEGALEATQEADRLAQRSGVGEEIVKAAVWKARLHLTMGDLATAAFEQDRAAGVSGGVPLSVLDIERIGLTRLLVTREEHDEALEMLARIREAAEASGKTGEAIEILALEAVALQAKGEKEQAVGTLARALALAEPEGYVRTFADEGSPMAALLSEALDAKQRGRLAPDVPAYYLRKLSAALERDASSAAAPAGVELREPLSERELEVLALLAAGKSNQQIASELFVALSTVKTHIKNIYGKLDVRNRAQAVTRARELNLL